MPDVLDRHRLAGRRGIDQPDARHNAELQQLPSTHASPSLSGFSLGTGCKNVEKIR